MANNLIAVAPSEIARMLWLIPALPIAASGVIALLKQPRRKTAQSLAIGSLGISLILAVVAFAQAVAGWSASPTFRETVDFDWFEMGTVSVRLGWLLDPPAAVMLAMVTFVGLLIFVYSTGYMAQDRNATRFFCFLSLFTGAMLTVVIANSLLLLFMGWEVMGLTSYLLIGFWYHKPAAAAAAKKAFMTTRVGDIFFLLGMVWLFAQTGTLLFYDGGLGAMESAALASLLTQPAAWGLTAAGAIALLIFCGAAGKSGQLPLHVWLPDAMEGPTPVSALIHAATMVAAGVYLVARVYPLMAAGAALGGTTIPLTVVAWVGASTAVFAALIAVAQDDIKRILAYSTISQLGYMMVGLATGGVAAGMFHLITHAFFKALLFLGAGSVIHGCHEEQNIRRMGGLRADMPWTFAAYSAGMLALCGFPFLFSGFWSKDGILEAAHGWGGSGWGWNKGLFLLLALGALLTAFYMTRQVAYVFFGYWRGTKHAHESPAVMIVPLAILSLFAVALGFLGTPAWPWFQSFVGGEPTHLDWRVFLQPGLWALMGASAVVVVAGLFVGWRVYGTRELKSAGPDPVERAYPTVYGWLRNQMSVHEFYDATVIEGYRRLAVAANWLDTEVWGGLVRLTVGAFQALARFDRWFDRSWVDAGFDKGCEEMATGGGLLARLQGGKLRSYLAALAVAVVVLALLTVWGARP